MLSKIVDSYFDSRPNKDFIYPKVAVLFLACSGSGKTTIAQKIIEELGATYLRNDDARLLLEKHGQEVLPKRVVDATWERVKLETKNQFVVFDSNMSSYYMHEDSYYNVARREGYKTFIIALDIPEGELRHRIQGRQRDDTQEVLGLLPAQLAAWRKATNQLRPDFIAGTDTNSQEIIEALRRFVVANT